MRRPLARGGPSGRESRARVTDLSTNVGSVALPSPVLTAAGTAGHGAELESYVDLSSLGAVVVKSLAPYPWEGNPAVRVHQTPSGMINSVGLQGPGVQAWLVDELPKLQAAGARVVVSIWGQSVADYAAAAEMLAGAGAGSSDAGSSDPGSSDAGIVAVEVNISCPNTEHGNELFAHDAAMTAEVMKRTAACGLPRWAKLSPNVGPALPDIAAAAVEGGAEAVTLVNTYFGLSIDPVTRRPRLGAVDGPGRPGGVSGPAIHPLAVKAVADVRAAHPDITIVAAGGVASAVDVVEFALVGASAVQVGTANFADPRACARITTELDAWCARQGIRSFAELIGAARFDG